VPSTVAERAARLRELVDVRSGDHVMPIDAAIAAGFASAVGAPRRVTAEGEVVAPPTLITRMVSADRPEWYATMGREHLLHIAERQRFHRPLVVGRDLVWQSAITGVRETRGSDGRRLWIVASGYWFRDGATGEPVAEVTRTRAVLDEAA